MVGPSSRSLGHFSGLRDWIALKALRERDGSQPVEEGCVSVASRG